VPVKLIYLQLVVHPQKNEQCTANAERQPKDVYKGKQLVPENTAESDKEVILKHTGTVLDKTDPPKQSCIIPIPVFLESVTKQNLYLSVELKRPKPAAR
jgi:hypothetical protein